MVLLFLLSFCGCFTSLSLFFFNNSFSKFRSDALAFPHRLTALGFFGASAASAASSDERVKLFVGRTPHTLHTLSDTSSNHPRLMYRVIIVLIIMC